MGMAAAGLSVAVALTVVVPVFALIAGLGVAARRRLPKIAHEETLEKKQRMRAFGTVNVVQWIAIFGTVNLLRNLHLEGWIVPGVVLIVGAHFLPLAWIFKAPQHRVTGIALMVCAGMALVLPATVRDVVECVAAGLILWVSAVVALRAAFRNTPRSRLAAQASL
jgi:hypothetical protein